MENIPLAGEVQGVARPRRNPLFAYFASSIGKKAIMATTGAILVAYVIVHLIANFQLYQGADSINAYAKFLHDRPIFLWAARAVLLAAAILHVVFGIRLWMENRDSRPERYVQKQNVQATLASRTMIYSGIIVLAFIIYHVMHLTLGAIYFDADTFLRHDVFKNMIRGFQNPAVSGTYIVGQLFLYFHLAHGIQSMFLTFGFNNPRYSETLRKSSLALAFLIAAGNISFPVVILARMVQ